MNKVHQSGCLEDSVHQGFWTEDLSSSLPIGQRPPSVLCHVGLSNIIAYFKAREIEVDRGCVGKMEVTIF